MLGREKIRETICNILHQYPERCQDIQFKKGIFVYGSPGVGKTVFVQELIKELGYDMIRFDAGDIRNKALVETLTRDHLPSENVLSMLKGEHKKIVIVMDEVESMNNGDKGGLTALIKLIRQKKTKKQKLENTTMIPIICIGNYYVDKKIKELLKVCHTFELLPPTDAETMEMCRQRFPTLPKEIHTKLVYYVEGDLRKLDFFTRMYQQRPDQFTTETLENIFQVKKLCKDPKRITQTLLTNPVSATDMSYINETDRTIVALLWHENIINELKTVDPHISFPFYLKFLENMCYADYVDRITFQNQIWQFNEMSTMMKTFANNKLYHDTFPHVRGPDLDEIRFTKVLTKYSTEYNNGLFVIHLCQELGKDRKDICALFQELLLVHKTEEGVVAALTTLRFFDTYSVTKLDVKRMYRYLNRNIKEVVVSKQQLLEDVMMIEEGEDLEDGVGET